MKYLKILALLFLANSSLFAQIFNPVSWSFESKQVGVNEFELTLHADIDEGWHLYSQHLPSDDGPIATSFYFNANKDVDFVGKVNEPKSKTEFDPNFDMELSFFDKKVDFKQIVRVKNSKTEITGVLEFMVCNDKMCLPPEEVEFDFKLIADNSKYQENTEVKKPEKSAEIEKVELSESENIQEVNSENKSPKIYKPVIWESSLSKENVLTLTAKIDSGWHLYSLDSIIGDGPIATEINFLNPENYTLVGDLEIEGKKKVGYDPNFMMDLSYYETLVTFRQKIKPKAGASTVDGEIYFMCCNDEMCITPENIPFSFELNNVPVESEKEKEDSAYSLLGIFIAGFLGGLLALLTPCVFPMIPLTVSFFTKRSPTRAKGISNALIYGASIIGIYVLLGFGITVIFGADALNALATNVWFNISFFILFVVFAISFFGAFEITLPSSWVNKADSASDKGGLIGIFFMAFTLSLVSFSCTGPIIGTLLVEAAVNGGVKGPLIGMFGFSSALALPFALFAAFPGWLNSLPKSGGWLNSVKVTLGFLELALALKFLSNADLVVQAGYITREVFLTIWIGIFAMMTIYLLGFLKLPHDSDLKHISVPRLFFAMLSFFFTIYLIPGLWGAPLKLISGFPPPMFYSESPDGVGKSSKAAHFENAKIGADTHLSSEHCPHNLNCFHDYEDGLAYAKKVNKPVMIDFTGWACVNCRKMEEQVWSDPRVLNRLAENVVLISLYVDDKTPLPEDEQIEVVVGNKTKKIKTIANKWSYFQADVYKTNAQPHYVILDHNENQLHEAAAYDPDIEKFIDWLDRGVNLFKKSKS